MQSTAKILLMARKQHYLALSSVGPDGHPQVATLRYAISEDFEIILGTLLSSRKIANLRRDPRAAAVIWNDLYSIQIEGTADEPTGPELQRIKQVFADAFPLDFSLRESRASHLFFRIRPDWLRYSDFTHEPARFTTISFAEGTERQGVWPPLAPGD